MTKRPIRLLPLVEIEWVDSHSTSDGAWHSVDEARSSVEMSQHTVGYLIEDTRSWITLVGSLSLVGDRVNQVSGDMTIPKIAIVKRRTLRK